MIRVSLVVRLRGRARRGPVTGVRGCRLVDVTLVVSGRRILRVVVLRVILAIVLWVVLWAVLAIVLLWIVTLLFLLYIAPERHPQEAPLGWRWRGVLVWITLLLWGIDESHVGPSDPPSPEYSESKEDPEYDQETCDCDCDARSGAQSLPANNFTESIVITISLSHCGRR